MNKLIVFTMKGKGGVGATSSLVSLVEYLDINKISRILVDCDMDNRKTGMLSSYYPEAIKLDIRKPESLQNFTNIVSVNDIPVFIVDFGVVVNDELIEWFNELYSAIKNPGLSFLAVGSVTSSSGSIETIFRWAEDLGNRVKYLIVKNNFQGEPELWENGKLADDFRAACKPYEITIKTRIPEWQAELENLCLTLTKAMEFKEHPIFYKISAECRLRMWRKQIFEEFDKVNEIFSI